MTQSKNYFPDSEPCRILFIINPIAGGKKKDRLRDLINRYLDHKKYAADFIFTEYAGHAYHIVRDEKDKYQVFVAVGGDGTVNEVFKGAMQFGCTAAVVPHGSGNGLSNSLKISRKVKLAVNTLNLALRHRIDAIQVNGDHFFNIGGMGFDAHIARLFRSSNSRGLWTYVKLVVSRYFRYSQHEYQMTIDGDEHRVKAFLISLANSQQFGNNAFIAPGARLDDGILNVSVLKKFPIIYIPSIAIRLFMGTLDKSRYFSAYTATSVHVRGDGLETHLDGEYIDLGNELEIKVIPAALEVIVPEAYLKNVSYSNRL